MTQQQPLPGMGTPAPDETPWPLNTASGRWMVKRGWTWDALFNLWQIPGHGEGVGMTHERATAAYFEQDEPPF